MYVVGHPSPANEQEGRASQGKRTATFALRLLHVAPIGTACNGYRTDPKFPRASSLSEFRLGNTFEDAGRCDARFHVLRFRALGAA